MASDVKEMSSLQALVQILGGLPDVVIEIFKRVGNEGCMNFIKSHKEVHKSVWRNFYYMRFMVHAWCNEHPNMNTVPNFVWGPANQMVDNRYFVLARLPLSQRIMPTLEAPFMKFLQTFMHIKYIKGCGVCNNNKAYARMYWQIGNAVCHECRCSHFISDRRLHYTYGLQLSTMVGGRTVMQWISGVVCVVRLHSPCQDEVLSLTVDKLDIDAYTPKKELLFFWLPHLAKVFDMRGLQRLQDEKKYAVLTKLKHWFRALFVRRVWMTTGIKKRSLHDFDKAMAEHHMHARMTKKPSKKRSQDAAIEYDDLTRGLFLLG